MCQFLKLLWVYSKFLFLLNFEFVFQRNYLLKFSMYWYEVYICSIYMTDLISTVELFMFLSSFLIVFTLCFLFFSLVSLFRGSSILSVFSKNHNNTNVYSGYLWAISIIFIFLCILQNFSNKYILTLWTFPIIPVIKWYTFKQSKRHVDWIGAS